MSSTLNTIETDAKTFFDGLVAHLNTIASNVKAASTGVVATDLGKLDPALKTFFSSLGRDSALASQYLAYVPMLENAAVALQAISVLAEHPASVEDMVKINHDKGAEFPDE